MQPVIHDDEIRAGRTGRSRTGRTIARHDGRGDPRKLARLVAHLIRQMGADPDRAGKPPAIAAGKKERAMAGRHDQSGDGDCSRSFSRSADGEIAEAHHRHRRGPSRPRHAPGRDRPVEAGGRSQQRRGSACLPPPEGGITHERGGSESAAA